MKSNGKMIPTSNDNHNIYMYPKIIVVIVNIWYIYTCIYVKVNLGEISSL